MSYNDAMKETWTSYALEVLVSWLQFHLVPVHRTVFPVGEATLEFLTPTSPYGWHRVMDTNH